MMTSYAFYNVYTPQECYAMSAACRSVKSSKASSRKGSTDIDSLTKFKTEVCKYWSNQIECPYGNNCNFAHGDIEVRSRDSLPSKYKTKKCQKFNTEGYCMYGYRCQFIHCSSKHSRVPHEAVLDCLAVNADMFFSFLDERTKNSGRNDRLPVFERFCYNNDAIKEEEDEVFEEEPEPEDYQNLVNIRPRHSSF